MKETILEKIKRFMIYNYAYSDKTINEILDLKDTDKKELLSRFTEISELDIYGGFTAISNDIKYYITIVIYE